jgi:GNAT superfamily N-acetyltransferase
VTEVLRVSGHAVTPYIEALAELRMRVFREFPYLYDGAIDYEMDYLESYTKSEQCVVVVAKNINGIIGASTGMPLAGADQAFKRPFEISGHNVGEVFYFGESVLEQSERGMGIGHQFFDERETHARALGFKVAAFCAVARADDHPLRPSGYRALDDFWIKLGFVKRPDLIAELAWPQIDNQGLDVTNRLVFWLKSLAH